jgi:hypothetical protein
VQSGHDDVPAFLPDCSIFNTTRGPMRALNRSYRGCQGDRLPAPFALPWPATPFGSKVWRGTNAGYTSGVAGVDARRATPPDPRLPRRGLAGCRQLDPSHPALVTCGVARVKRARFKSRLHNRGGWGRHPKRDAQIRIFRAWRSLAVASSTPATQLLSSAKMLKLNHASSFPCCSISHDVR